MEGSSVKFTEDDIRALFDQGITNLYLIDHLKKIAQNKNPGSTVINVKEENDPYSITIRLSYSSPIGRVPPELIITDEEMDMLKRIGKIVGYCDKEEEYLKDIFQTIKIQKIAYHIDIAPLMNLGIPMYNELAKIRNVQVSDVVHTMATSSVTFDEIKRGFINLTSEGGIYS